MKKNSPQATKIKRLVDCIAKTLSNTLN